MSMAAHIVLFVVLGLLVRHVPQGAADEPGRTAGIVLAQVSNNSTNYYSEADSVVEAETTESAAAAAASAMSQAQRPSLPSLDGLLPSVQGGAAGSTTGAGSLPDATSLLEGSGLPGDIGQGTTTQVFGVQGSGSRFVYVFDRSSSMDDFAGRPLQVAKQEMVNSLFSLRRTNEFQIVFYNERPTIFNPNAGPATLLFATDIHKEEAGRFINSIRARGGTQHLEAIEAALRMNPDVIFFLTDAAEPQLTAEELQLIDRWNRTATTINTIEFGIGPKRGGINWLELVARQNNGQYVYKDVTEFRDAP
ncbi:MAG: hypothetical protein KDA83_06825 [Planctomycetales bacterium]|nr:hypothetical protein [Planctomycetales bacterium]